MHPIANPLRASSHDLLMQKLMQCKMRPTYEPFSDTSDEQVFRGSFHCANRRQRETGCNESYFRGEAVKKWVAMRRGRRKGRKISRLHPVICDIIGSKTLSARRLLLGNCSKTNEKTFTLLSVTQKTTVDYN